MARGFGATLGVSTSDIIRGAAFPTPTVFSFACWYYKNGAGGLGNARIFDKEGTTPGDIILRNSNSTSSITTSKGFSTTSGVWQTTDSEAFATGKWVHIVETYDASSTANVPTIYINGRLATVTTVTAPVGTANTGNSGTLSIGNRSTAGVDWDGAIDDPAWWTGIKLTAAEARALYQGADPRNIRPQYLTEYLIFNEGRPYSAVKAKQPTITGTKVRSDRLVITQGRAFPFGKLGGTTFNDTLTQTATATDGVTVTATFATALTETATATDTYIGGSIFNDTLGQTATATDGFTIVVTFNPTLTETATGADTVTVLATINATLSQGATATDNYIGGSIFNDTLSQSATAGDSITSQMAFGPTLTETATSADVYAVIATFAPAYGETATAGFSLSDGSAASIWTTIAPTSGAWGTQSASTGIWTTLPPSTGTWT